VSSDQVVERFRPLTVLASTHNLIKNATFDGSKSLPWTTSFTAPGKGAARVERGALCVEVTEAGVHPWDAQFRHREMTIQKGHSYAVRFKIGSTTPTEIEAKVAMSGPPYKAYWHMGIDVDAHPHVVTEQFTMNGEDDATAEFAFHIGGKKAAKHTPFTVCVDDVVLEDPAFQPNQEAPPVPAPKTLVSQIGYLPNFEKVAIVKSASPTPLPWQMFDGKGAVVASGTTLVRGADAASGDSVHWADFSTFATPGEGFTLSAGGEASHPFDIAATIYRKLKYAAMAFYYQNRSGIAIAMPYAGEARWTRPAGHVGDKNVACAADAHCDYSLDVSGGWYDAGDHGKYVVNGGISVWTLLDFYERTQAFGSSASDFGDGKLNIPEGHNGAPDLLDEVRWELDFMMKMQVPEGHPLAGMAHHKIHDREWTALATRPDQDAISRFLRPVSTAATLNLAATGAQCARVWKAVDGAFASRCLRAAERAFAAALAHPALFAPPSDTIGGGPYEDDDVSDEFYWAAAELYAATKKDVYRDFVMNSPYHDEVPTNAAGQTTAMTWQVTEALGTITLAVVPFGLSAPEVSAARAAVVQAADAFLAIEHEQGYRVPFKPSGGGYPWASNSFILNNALVMALAFDFTKDKKYVDAVQAAMGYILGGNPNDQSYVTGFGLRPLQNPHHRFWAHQANAAFPSAPPGVLSGGPNSGLQDPYVQADGLQGCAPMKCYADNIEAYSTNEEAINWNAPLVWVAAFLDEQATKTRSGALNKSRRGPAEP
jgi:endoglucanase